MDSSNVAAVAFAFALVLLAPFVVLLLRYFWLWFSGANRQDDILRDIAYYLESMSESTNDEP